MPLTTLMVGVLLGLSAGAAPGPLLALVITQSLAYGIAEGIKVAVAPLITDLPIILAAVLLGSQLAASPLLLGLLSMAGAAYICFLAWESITAGPVAEWTRARSPGSIRKGVLTNFLNPHPYLFWITVGTPLLHRLWADGAAPTILWLMGFYIMLVGTKVMLAVLVGRWRGVLRGKAYVWCNRALGMLLIGFAAVLARDGIRLMWG